LLSELAITNASQPDHPERVVDYSLVQTLHILAIAAEDCLPRTRSIRTRSRPAARPISKGTGEARRFYYSQSANVAIASGAVVATGAGVYNLSEH